MSAFPQRDRRRSAWESRGFTIVEAVIALVVVVALIAIILPLLQQARLNARRDQCALNQTTIGAAWMHSLREDEAFPDVETDPAWGVTGATFSRITGDASLDFSRPLNQYIPASWERGGVTIFESPLDRGIEGAIGIEAESVYRARGISYRANTMLLDARECGLDESRRPLRVEEVKIDPEWVIIMGPPFWHETVTRSSREAPWYGAPDEGRVLFMDGSVRSVKIEPGVLSADEYALVPSDDRGD